MSDRPNILFIVIDQFRADCLHGVLDTAVDLPNLRAFAAESVSFRQNRSVVNPCGPSRASLLTGQYAMNHRAVRNGTPLPADTPNLATEVRKAGYLPLLFGYTDCARDPRDLAPGDPALTSYEEVMPGFHEVVEMRQETSLPWRSDLIRKGYDLPPYPDIFRPQSPLSGDPSPDDPALYRAEDSDTAFLTDQFIAGMTGRPQGWFAHLTYIRPHPPLVAPAPYNKMYDPAKMPAPVTVGDRGAEQARHPFVAAQMDATPVRAIVQGFPDLEATPENLALMRAIYFGLATEVDHHIGRVIAWLKDQGTYENTILVVTADHAEMLGDHHAWGKSTVYDAAWHTPLMIRVPGGRARVVDQPTESVDIAPTLLDLLGLAVPAVMDGRPLTPFLAGDAPVDWRDYSYSELDFGDPIRPTHIQSALDLPFDTCNLCILRGPRHTLVHFNGGLPPMLFDRHGAGELRDIAADPAAQGHLLAMTRALLNHRMRFRKGLFNNTMVTETGIQTK
tara:strand:+ start:4228 stop:5739 length:1512 start_codon:yes stop_codon:yes gene_type:complete